MTKKKILFLLSSWWAGGTHSAMSSIYNCYDRDKWDVSIYIISNTGTFNFPDADKEITLSCKLSTKDASITKTYKVKALSIDKTNYISEISKLAIPNSTDADIKLENSISISNTDYSIVWSSSNENAIGNDGKIKYVSEDTSCTLTATIKVKNVNVSKEWSIVIKPAGGLKLIQDTPI